MQLLSLKRLRHILELQPKNESVNPHILKEIEKYGISNKAALREYYKQLGGDWETQQVIGK